MPVVFPILSAVLGDGTVSNATSDLPTSPSYPELRSDQLCRL